MADVLAVRDEYRAQQWAMLIQESKSSGMTNKDFCIQRLQQSGVYLLHGMHSPEIKYNK